MNICDHVSVSVKTVFCKETEKCSLKWVEGYFCFAFKFWIFSLKKSWNLEYKVTICCIKNDDHKKVVSPFNLIELWFFFYFWNFQPSFGSFYLRNLFQFYGRITFRCKLAFNRRFVFRLCVIHCWRTFCVLMFLLKEIVKMLHLCQKKIQRFLQIIKCVKIRNFLQNVECVFANMFGLSLTFF